MDKDQNAQGQPGDAPRSGAKWGQDRRLEFLEYRLRWDGRFNRSDLTSFFGISTPQASLDVAEYLKRAPDNLQYDRGAKLYVPSPRFVPQFSSSSVERYLEDLLRASHLGEVPYGSFLASHPPVAHATRPTRRVATEVVVAVVRAIREREGIDMLYQSFTSPEPSRRLVSPHALAHDGFRWHMRAYCHARREYRDFVLSRMISAPDPVQVEAVSKEDVEWERMLTVVLAPHPGLGTGHRHVVELDYSMQDGRCEFQCRQALFFYVLQQLRLDDFPTTRSPEAQQIVLANREELAPFLPKKGFR